MYKTRKTALSENSTVSDHSPLAWTSLRSANAFHLPNYIKAFDDFPKNNMLTVKPGCVSGANEKLRTVGVWTGVGHRERSQSTVIDFKVFIVEFCPIDRLPASSIAFSKVSSLTHEAGDDPVECGILESITLLLRYAQLHEVFYCDRHFLTVQTHFYATSWFFAYTNVEVYSVGN